MFIPNPYGTILYKKTLTQVFSILFIFLHSLVNNLLYLGMLIGIYLYLCEN